MNNVALGPIPPVDRRAGTRLTRVAAALASAVAVVLLAAACSRSDAPSTTTADGFVLEPAGEIGPDAFTAPFTAEASICDKKQFLRDLQARPEAYREWARILDIAPDDVPAYIETLTPKVLVTDTKVINHGLRDGRAYARKSLLPAGTAVLVDGGSSGTGSVQGKVAQSTTTSTTSGSGTTLAGHDVPVTRCKCGNPLLPPDNGGPPGSTPPGTTVTGSSTTQTTRPPSTSTTGRSTTSSSSPGSSSSTTSTSMTTTTTLVRASTSSSTPPSSASTSTSTPISTTTPPQTTTTRPFPPSTAVG